MGNCSTEIDRTDLFKEVNQGDFVFKQVIGRGGFGKVSSMKYIRCGK